MATMTKILKREKKDRECASTEQDDVQFYNKVQAKLGYHIPKKYEPNTRDKILLKLFDMDIVPYTNASVEEYKEKMLAKQPNGNFHMRAMICETIGLLVSFVSFFSAVALVGCGTISGWWLLLPAAAFPSIMAVMFYSGKYMREYAWHWTQAHMFDLKHYDVEVPEFALQTALDVQEKIPELTFYVEYLHCEVRQADPFLLAKDRSGNTYYLEVWDEVEYKKKWV